MSLISVVGILNEDDGSLPDINFNFACASVAADAYALIQSRATTLTSVGSYYWSKTLEAEVPIAFGQNPAVAFLNGESEPFHVVFGGLSAESGAKIPDLGFFVLGTDFVALDYRMGPEWDVAAVEGLFDLMRGLSNLAECRVTHTENISDPMGTILCGAFENYVSANHKFRRTPDGTAE
jgi:hypothetical protein